MQKLHSNKKENYYTFLLLVSILLIAATLRSPMTSFGPLIPFIREDLAVSNFTIGLVNTLPLLMFGLFSPLVPKISRKTGMELMLLIAMITLTIGIIFRSLGNTPMLLLGTLLLGLGIAVGNVLMPGLIKLSFPLRIGIMMGIYSVSMNLFGALASGLSVPLAEASAFNWQYALLLWAVLSSIAVFFICLRLPVIRSSRKKVPGKVNNQPSSSIFKSKIAWSVSLFMGLQSFIPYSLFTWLPDILLTKGFSENEAGWFMALMQIGLIPATFFVPIFAAKLNNQAWVGVGAGLLFLTGLVGVALTASQLTLVFLIITGMGMGTAFSLAMMFFVLRTHSVEQSSQLSSMAQSVGYMIAALGPFFLGTIAEWTNGWTVPLLILMSAAIGISLFGYAAGKDRKIAI
ncbi:MFS transporter [Shouchella sp. 1P09AA]|uniref:CynX/NimT family MFS transporter n=1 Tax=unclassified Shouchella TaxID=2893065 RepID=UPI0039A20F14